MNPRAYYSMYAPLWKRHLENRIHREQVQLREVEVRFLENGLMLVKESEPIEALVWHHAAFCPRYSDLPARYCALAMQTLN